MDRVEVDRLEVDRVEVDRLQVDRLQVDGRRVVDLGLALTRRLGALRRTGPGTATAALVAALVLIAAALTPVVLGHRPAAPPGTDVRLSWWLLVVLFVAAELSVVHVEIRRDAHSFTLSEVALVLALLFAGPADLLVVRLAGAAVVLVLFDRVSAPKLVFNLALFWAESCVLLLIFQAFGGSPGMLDARTWAAALIGVVTASGLGAVAVWAVIRCQGGAADHRLQLVVATGTAVCNASLAGVTAVLLAHRPWALLPLAVVVLVVVGAYRRHIRLSRRYAGLEALHTFTRATSGAVTQREVIATVLESAREVLGAGTAVITLRPSPGVSQLQASAPAGVAFPAAVWRRVAGEGRPLLVPADTDDPALRSALDHLAAPDVVVAPILAGDDVVGALLLADRLRGRFDADDARLLAALVTQAGVALDRGRLVQEVQGQARAREYEALHDALTGLPNRVLFARELERELATARADGACTGVLLLDLDQFKEVNDTLGHHRGDQLLRQVADRLIDFVGHRGLVARLGGDEFAVLLPRLTADTEAIEVSRGLHARMIEPIRLAELRLEIGASIGVAIQPDHGDDGETLLQRADVAMYAAKRARERVVVYDPLTDWNSPLRLRLAAELRAAIAGGQLAVCYQPIVDVATLEVTSVEALARWPHPEFGELRPDEFIPIAERTGLIGPLTDYVLRRSIEQSAQWRSAGFDLRVAVNLSVHTLVDGDWSAGVLALLDQHAVPPGRVSFEITESGIMADPRRMIAMLDELAAAGWGSRSTTSGPATRRCPTCSSCRSAR
jgi:diguanylate cyclase (GGDEF)-like protein